MGVHREEEAAGPAVQILVVDEVFELKLGMDSPYRWRDRPALGDQTPTASDGGPA